MKKHFLTVVFVGLSVFVAAGMSFAGKDAWPKARGELCWKIYMPLSDAKTGCVRLAVEQSVGSFFQVSGYFIESDQDQKQVISGSAFRDGERIIMQVTASSLEGEILSSVPKPADPNNSVNYPNEVEARAAVGRIVLDATDLNGWYSGIELGADADSSDVGFGPPQYLEFQENCGCFQ
jgi:hypothetical protein